MNIVQSIMLSVLIAYSFGAVPAQAASAKSEVTVNPGVLEYARTYRVSVDEAEWRLSKLRYIGEMGNRIETASPGTFAGIWIEHTPAFRVVVRFVGDPKAQLAKYTQDPLFVPETAPRSLEVQIAAQTDIADRLAKAGIDFTSDIDLKKSEINLYVQDPAAVLRQFAVVFRVSPFIRVYKGSGSIDLTEISGGARLKGATVDIPNCTTGLNVFDSNRELGITTAGHCNDAMTYVSTRTKLDFQSESSIGSYDIQWHKQRIRQSATPQQQKIASI